MTPVRWVVASVGVAVALLGIVLISALHTNTAFTPNPTKGRRAPSFALPALGGGSVSLAENAGKVTVLNFWNDWCIPCQSEQSDLNALWTAHKVDTGFAMIGIVHDPHSRADIVRYARDQRIGWPVVFDPGATTALNYAVTGQPETFVIDKLGIVRAWISGPIDRSRLDVLVRQLELE